MRGNNEDLEFMPDVYAATLRRGNRFAYILTLLTGIFFVSFVIWAGYAVLDEVTRGEGRIVPSSKTQVIQNLEGGILAEILVREGDIVEQGDILVRIDNTMAQANFRDLRGQYHTLAATVARLEAEEKGGELAMPEEVLKDAPLVAADQERLFRARRQQLENQVGVLETQVRQREQEIAEMASRRNQLKSSLQLASEELKITQRLVKKGLSPKVDLLRIERQVNDLTGELKTTQLAIPRLKSATEEARQRVAEVRSSALTEIAYELNKARADLKSVRETLSAGQDRVTRTEVRSFVRGTVKQLMHNTLGGVIRPGEDIIEIVPLDDTLLIETRIRPADIAFLRPGQKAIVKIAAYDFSIYGGLDAELERISADTIRDEQGDNYYRVYLRTDKNSLAHQGEELPIIPGMTATVEILTGKKSVLDYLLKPVLKARNQALRER